MADSRINLLTLSTSTASDDFFVTDGSANGTRRLSAFNPTIGGSLTVSAMISAGNQISTTAGLVCQNADVTGGYMTLRGFGNQDTGVVFLGQTANNNYISSNATTIGVTIGNVGITQTVAAGFRVSSTTNSTNTSSGALIVGNGSSGGLGVGGDTFIGGSLTVTGTSNGIICNGAGLSLNTSGSASVRFQDAGVSKWWIYKLSGDINLYYRDMLNSRMQAIMVPGASNTTASTDFYSNVVCKGTLYVSSTTAQVILGEASASQLTYLIRPAQAGGAIQIVQDSATVNRWLALGGCDNNGVFFEALRIGGATGNILVTGTNASTSVSSGALVIGNGTQGGLGVSGNIYLGGSLNSTLPDGKIAVIGTGNTAGTKELVFQRADGGDSTILGLTGSAYAGVLTGLGNNEAYLYTSNAFAFRIFVGTAATNRFDFTNSQFKINATTSSANTSSGALVVSGGVGVGGNLNIGGQLDLNSGTAAAPSLKLNSTNNGIYYTGSNIVRIAANGAEAATFGATAATIVGSFQTAAPTGGTSAPWKLGTVATVTPTSPNRTIEVEINGVTYYLHAKTTNN